MKAILDKALAEKRDLVSSSFAAELDAADAVKTRDEFCFPTTDKGAHFRTEGEKTLYLCGNSLGLMPKRTKDYINEELKNWGEFGVEGHFTHKSVSGSRKGMIGDAMKCDVTRLADEGEYS